MLYTVETKLGFYGWSYVDASDDYAEAYAIAIEEHIAEGDDITHEVRVRFEDVVVARFGYDLGDG